LAFLAAHNDGDQAACEAAPRDQRYRIQYLKRLGASGELRAFLSDGAGGNILTMIHLPITKSGSPDGVLSRSAHLANIIGPDRASTFQAQDLRGIVGGNVVVDVFFFL